MFSLSETEGGKETFQKVASAFYQSRQQVQASASTQQQKFDFGAVDLAVFEMLADLHDKSVLYLDGRDYSVVFPYPEGLEAFEGALNRINNQQK